jgi:hypothetical protein
VSERLFDIAEARQLDVGALRRRGADSSGNKGEDSPRAVESILGLPDRDETVGADAQAISVQTSDDTTGSVRPQSGDQIYIGSGAPMG